MSTLFVLVKCARGKTEEAGNRIVNLRPSSVEVYSITGEYDLLVKTRFENPDEIQDFVQNSLHAIDAVVETNTFLSFRMYGDFTVF
jgi:DNA-binding Lrp family transcriptional regulator